MSIVTEEQIAEPGTITGGTNLPTSGSNLFANDLICSKTLGKMMYSFTASVAGILTVTYTKNGVVTFCVQFGGATIQPNVEMPGNLLVSQGETVNFIYTYSGSGTCRMIVREV